LEFANLEKEIVIIGVLNRIELWSPDAYAKEERESDPTKIGSLGDLKL